MHTDAATTHADTLLIDSLDAGANALATPGDRWSAAAGAWIAEVERRSGSKRTPAEYAKYVARFLAGLPGDAATATPALAHAFAYAPGASGKAPSPSTIIVRLAALQSFYDFCRRMRLLDGNPIRDVKRPKGREAIPRGLAPEELKRLLAAIPDTASGARDRAAILTMAYTGLRRTELLNLRVGDLESEGGIVFYTARTKGGHERRYELPPPAFAAIREALERSGRPLEDRTKEERLFAISEIGFYANLRRYAEKAGLEGVTPHALRHSAAKMLRQSGASIEDVSDLLGHRNIATTARYLKKLEGGRNHHWPGVAALLGD
jgi:site-specific recombinase XerD